MNTTKTSQGYVLSELYGNYIFKMHYIGYSLTECKRRFKAMQKDQKKRLNLKP